ncbi:MAG: response regulator [Oligoflexia bacterium]|nr:response regulator [Oligoflexia bacterium]
MKEKNKTILVVDDDENLRRTIARILQLEGYKVLEAKDGHEGLSVLELNQNVVSAILSDIRMPILNGIEFFHQCKKTFTGPFIFMTGFSDIIDVKESFEIGVKGFINKPFKRGELFFVLDDLLRDPNDETTREYTPHDADDFFGIPIDIFTTGHKIQFPIYLKLSPKKFVKLTNQGEDLPNERIAKIKQKGILELFLHIDDYKKYINFNLGQTEKVLTDNTIDRERKVRFVDYTNKLLYNYIFLKDLDQEIFDELKNNINMTVRLISSSPVLFTFLENMSNEMPDLYHHGISVAIIANLIAKQRKWTSPSTTHLIMLAGTLLDIGVKDIIIQTINKSYSDLDHNERILINGHPHRGVEILKQFSGIPEGLDQILLQHHERADGSGYPSGLKTIKIYPLALLIGLADAFCVEYFGGVFAGGVSGCLNQKTAFERLLAHKEKFNKEDLIALATTFAIPNAV